MIGTKFTYNGRSCDEYGLFVGEFEETSTGKMGVVHQTDLITARSNKNNEFNIIAQPYSSPLSFEMKIFNKDSVNISQEQERAIKKWLLQRGQYHWFSMIDQRYGNIHLKANIHSPENIRVGNNIVGMSFRVSASTPYGYSEIIEQEFKVTDSVNIFNLYVDNDEDIWLYPDMTIQMLSDGNLEISNSLDDSKNIFKIENLKTNEIITINGSLPLICSSLNADIFNNFSKVWLRIADGDNVITVSNNCIITLTYREIRKVGIQ